jgi:steroid delta-isomerase-like uncharacterized protein
MILMSKETTTKLVEAWAKTWSGGPEGLERFVALFDDDCHYEDVPTGSIAGGKEQLAGFYQAVMVAAPDHTLKLVSIVANEHGAGAEYVVTGTHTGDFPGLPATGKPFRFRGASILKMRGGKIQQSIDYWDFSTSGFERPDLAKA